MRNLFLLAVIALFLPLLGSCGGSGINGFDQLNSSESPIPGQSQLETAFPAELPADALQPWETDEKSVSGIDAGSDFTAGRDWFLGSANGISENGEAARLFSGPGAVSYGIWRIPLGGSQPGTLSADVNLLDDGSGAPSDYYIGLANYGTGRWDWHGPFSDSHVRLSSGEEIASGGNYLSSVQNTFVCVLASNGSSVDVVGLGLNAYDSADSLAPGQPSGLTAIPVSGGLELQWLPVIASDLAGYRIFYSNKSFISEASAGVRQLDSLEGATRMLLSGLGNKTYIRISALDHSGNESPASDLISGTPLPGSAPGLLVTTNLVSGSLGSSANLSVSGADTYDIDSNGDGVYNVTGNSSGTVSIDTSTTGIIRPRVRGTSAGGEAVALGAVSLIITGNSRPLASATASPQFGDAPLDVTFTGLAEDTEDDVSALTFAWDFNGDGIYEAGTDSLTPASPAYATPGVYNAKFRVTDSDGASDVDTLTVFVSVANPGNIPPNPVLQLSKAFGNVGEVFSFDASGSNDPDGTVTTYYWDFDGNGSYDEFGPAAITQHVFSSPGVFTPTVWVQDDAGALVGLLGILRVNEVFNLDHPWGNRGHDYRHTGRSSYSGAQTSNLKWDSGTAIEYGVFSSPAVGADGTVYAGDWGHKLYAFNPDGSLKWDTGDMISNAVDSSPAIGPDGTVYVGSYDDHLYAINPNGTKKWKVSLWSDVVSSPAIGPDGKVYVGSDDGWINILHPDGTWFGGYETSGPVRSTPALGADGSVYVGSFDNKLYALNPDGSLKWDSGSIIENGIYSSPAIGPDGTIYLASGDSTLYAFNPNGSLKWDIGATNGEWVQSSPAIGADGTIYVGSDDNKLHAYNPDGSQKWDSGTIIGAEVFSSPAIGADGTIYVGSDDNKLYAFNQDGTLKWDSNSTIGGLVRSSPAIGADGTVYVGSFNGKLYAFGWNIGNLSPEADLAVDLDIANTTQTVTFDASGSTDNDGSIVNYAFDFDGDGNYDSIGPSATATHTYDVQYGYNAQVRVTDNHGGTDTASVQVVVTHGPWTMRGHDSLHNGRSPYIGPQTNNLKWDSGTSIGSDVLSSPAIGADGTIYVGGWDNKLHAFNPDGSNKWDSGTIIGFWVDSSPAIGADGTVYVGSDDHKLYAFNPDGSLKWDSGTIFGDLVFSSPAIDADGTVYVGSDDNKLRAFNPDGSLKWDSGTTIGGGMWSSPAIGTDGTVYVGSFDDKLYAFNPDGSLKWDSGATIGNDIYSSPAIGADGTVYVGSDDNKLYAFNPDGSLKWDSGTTIGDKIDSAPAIGADGTVYVGSWDNKLYAFNPDGSLQWDSGTTIGDWVRSSPAIGADGTIYVGSYDDKLYAFNPDGSLNWSYTTGGSVYSSPAIGADGTLYVGSGDGKLYAFGPTP
jgi:outer membrane protein assembly factor BamB